MSSLTVANSVIALTVPGLFDAPQILQGFSADNIYDVDQVEQVQTLMGVDGVLSGGLVYNPTDQTFVLQADSASCDLFDRWNYSQKAAGDTLIANGTTTLTGIGKTFTMTKGFLISASPLPVAGRIAQPRRFLVRWNKVQGAPK